MKRFIQFLSVIIVIAALVVLYTNKGKVPKLLKNPLLVGTYYGILPHSEYDGIETVFTIKPDSAYILKRKYLGKSDEIFIETGTIKRKENSNKIALFEDSDPDQLSPKWMKFDDKIFQILDVNGNVIKGEMASKYTLNKSTMPLVEIKWELNELYGKEVPMRTGSSYPYFMLELIDNTISGSGYCGGVSGKYKLTGDNLMTISDPNITSRQNCRNSRSDADFLRALKEVRSYKQQLGKLLLLDKNNRIVARFSSADVE